jgi:hypothetical protein
VNLVVANVKDHISSTEERATKNKLSASWLCANKEIASLLIIVLGCCHDLVQGHWNDQSSAEAEAHCESRVAKRASNLGKPIALRGRGVVEAQDLVVRSLRYRDTVGAAVEKGERIAANIDIL